MHVHVEHVSLSANEDKKPRSIKVEITAEDSKGVGRVETLRGVAFLGFMRMEDGNYATVCQGSLHESVRLAVEMPEMMAKILEILNDKVQLVEKTAGHSCRCPDGHHHA